MRYDCIIVGGGPAGLSAALMLGRCRRRVLVCDTGEQRNLRSHAIHAYPTRDGIAPADFLRLAREDLGRYESVELRRAEVIDARRDGDGFRVICAGGPGLSTRRLLLATGVVDHLPEIEGLLPLYGTSVHHCPYCDAWEWRDQPVAVYGKGESAVALALGLTVWTRDLLLCTDGPTDLDSSELERLDSAGIVVREDAVLRLDGLDGRLQRIVFSTEHPVPRRALFFCTGQRQQSPLAEKLGCRFTDKGAVDTGTCESTNVPGLFVAGDASREAQFVVVAAAEGAEAGMAINKSLLKDDLATREVTEAERASSSS